jgi:hypothetical protein
MAFERIVISVVLILICIASAWLEVESGVVGMILRKGPDLVVMKEERHIGADSKLLFQATRTIKEQLKFLQPKLQKNFEATCIIFS